MKRRYTFKKKVYTAAAASLDFFGDAFKGILLPKAETQTEPHNVVIIRMDHLGDVLLATAIPKAIKENLNSCRVTFLTSSWGAPLLRNNPFVDEIWIYDAPWFARGRYARSRQGFSYNEIVQKLRRAKFDTGLSLRGDIREHTMLFLGGIKKRIGFGITGGGFLLTHEVEHKKNVHVSELYERVLDTLNIHHVRLRPQIYLSESEKNAYAGRLRAFGWEEGLKHIGFQWGAGTSAKSWPLDHTARFLTGIGRRRPDCQIVLLGSGSPEEINKWLPGGIRCVNMVGRTSVRELCLAIQKLDVMVGMDSGPTHIASSLNVPTVYLYSGSNDLRVWGPMAENAFVLKHTVPCSPCSLEICSVPGHPCMTEITPESVLEKADFLLRGPL